MSGARRSPRKAPNAVGRGFERRFSDILEEDARNDAPNKRPRRPRKTLREEVADDLVFIRMTPQPEEAEFQSNKNIAIDERTRSDPRVPISRPLRRNSMSVKGMRRVSSLRDGAPAYPHDDIPDDVLYKHCSDQVPPVVRMKHLLSWTLHRSIPQALAEASLPRSGRRRHAKSRLDEDAELALLAPIPSDVTRELSELERQHIAEVSPILRRVVQDTLRDLNDGLIGISWLRHVQKNTSRTLHPHPRNESNRHAEKQLMGMLEQLQNELTSWKEHEADIGRIHEEVDALDAMTAEIREQASSKRKGRIQADDDAEVDEEQALADEVEWSRSGAPHATAWTWDDADTDARRQLNLVQTVLTSTDKLNHAVAAQQSLDTSRDIDLQGTEVDTRLGSLELSIDKIYRRLHTMEQLDDLSEKYIRRVSNRAAQTLLERTSAGLATFSGIKSDSDTSDLASSAVAQQQLDTLLSGIRDPNDTAHDPVQTSAVLPNDSHQLVRALARGPPT